MEKYRGPVLKLVTAAALLGFTVPLSWAIDSRRIEEKMVVESPFESDREVAESIDAGAVAGTILVGGFRVLVIDYLWVKFLEAKKEEEYHEILPVARRITLLQPRNTSTWKQLGNEMAVGLSARPDDAEVSWQWFKSGVAFITEGIGENPESFSLYAYLGYLFDILIPKRTGSMTPSGISLGEYYETEIEKGGLSDALDYDKIERECGKGYGLDRRELAVFFYDRARILFDRGLGEKYDLVYREESVLSFVVSSHLGVAHMCIERATKLREAEKEGEAAAFARKGLGHIDTVAAAFDRYSPEKKTEFFEMARIAGLKRHLSGFTNGPEEDR